MAFKAKPKGSSGWNKFETCVIGISIGNPNCDGEKLQAMVDWVRSRDNFTGCLIDLSDTLHRYNLMVEQNLTEPEAAALALELGDKWLERNMPILDTLKPKIEFRVMRWNDWLSDPVVEEYEKGFYKAFENDPTFRGAVLEDVNKYHERHARPLWGQIDNLDRIQLAPSIRYLVEELAVHSRLYEIGPCATLYPGDQQSSFRLVRAGEVQGVPAGLRNSHFVRMNIYDPSYSPKNDGGNRPIRAVNKFEAANDRREIHPAGIAGSYRDLIRSGFEFSAVRCAPARL